MLAKVIAKLSLNVIGFMCLLASSVPAFGQAIFVDPKSLETALQEQLVSERAFYVNGSFTQGLTPDMARKTYPLGPMSRTLITLVTLRMQAAGLLDLDESVARTLPDILDKNPFTVAITPRHLLAETAGFAVPPVNSSYLIPFKNHTTQVRTAGQMAHADLVGWQLLTEFLMVKGQADINQLIEEHLFTALTERPSAFQRPVSHMHFDWLGTIEYSADGIAELVRLYVRNRDKNGNLFLPADLHEQLTKRHAWRMHPIGPRRALGGEMRTLGTHTYVTPPGNPRTGKEPTFLAFPDQDIAFIHFGAPSEDYLDAIKKIAADRFLPGRPDYRLNEARNLREADDRFNGIYVRSDAPSAWLKDRLNAIEHETIDIAEQANGTIIVTGLSTGSDSFTKIAPFYYQNLGGETLLLSPFRQGGYLVVGDSLYRYVGILGNKTFVLGAFPMVMLMLLSSLIYVRSKTSPRWRKMALFGGIGTLMIAVGLWAEYSYWPQAVFEWNFPGLVTFWRVVLNAGLALVLSLPLFAMAFTKKNEMPTGAAILVVPLHLALISVSAISLFLILVAWGVAGEISAF